MTAEKSKRSNTKTVILALTLVTTPSLASLGYHAITKNEHYLPTGLTLQAIGTKLSPSVRRSVISATIRLDEKTDTSKNRQILRDTLTSHYTGHRYTVSLAFERQLANKPSEVVFKVNRKVLGPYKLSSLTAGIQASLLEQQKINSH